MARQRKTKIWELMSARAANQLASLTVSLNRLETELAKAEESTRSMHNLRQDYLSRLDTKDGRDSLSGQRIKLIYEFVMYLDRTIEQLKQRKDELSRQITALRDQCRAATSEKEKFDTVERNQEIAFKRLRTQSDQKEMDSIATMGWNGKF